LIDKFFFVLNSYSEEQAEEFKYSLLNWFILLNKIMSIKSPNKNYSFLMEGTLKEKVFPKLKHILTRKTHFS